MLPDVVIKVADGGLGRAIETTDSVSGMVLTGVAEGDMVLNKPFVVSSSDDVARLKITATQNRLIVNSINDFYAEAPRGVMLWIVVVAKTTTLTQMCDGIASPAYKLIEASNGSIRLMGVNRLTDSSYTAVIEKCIDKDTITAITKMQSLASDCKSKVMPFKAVVPAMFWTGSETGIYQPMMAEATDVSVVISGLRVGEVAVATVLGRAAKVSVATSIARVADGSIASTAVFSGGYAFNDKKSMLGLLHDSGYVVLRQFPTKNGFYLSDDPMACDKASDHSHLNIGRVIDKAYVLAYKTFVEFVNENAPIDDKGQVELGYCRYLESLAQYNISTAMRGEISSVEAQVDREVDLLATGQMSITLSIVPLGTIREIVVKLIVSNPNAVKYE